MRIDEINYIEGNPDKMLAGSVINYWYHQAKKDTAHYYFLSYTKLLKLGINPQSIYKTPIGIYAYPLIQAQEKYHLSSAPSAVPFAGKSPYIWVFKMPKSVNSIDLEHDKNSETVWKMLGKLKDFQIKYESTINGLDDIEAKKATYLLYHDAILNTNTGFLWNYSRLLAKIIKPEKPHVGWTFLLNKVLGLDLIIDSGSGIIHTSEPIQAVCFNYRKIEKLYLIHNN